MRRKASTATSGLISGGSARTTASSPVVASQQFAPVGGRLAEAELAAGSFGTLDRHVGDRNEVEFKGQVEDPRRDGEAERVGLAHEARADQTDPEFALAAHLEFLPAILG